jgi:hypothetical protein
MREEEGKKGRMVGINGSYEGQKEERMELIEGK